MARSWIACALVACTVTPIPALAQEPADTMSPLEITLACAPPPRLGPPPAGTLEIAGGQSAEARSAFGNRDTVVIAGGTAKGVSLGQRFFVRRTTSPHFDIYSGGTLTPVPPKTPHLVQTVGWVRVMAVNETTAIAVVEQACRAMTPGDYLEPFVVPPVPDSLSASTKLGELDFTKAAHVMFGDDERSSAASGEFIVADRGTAAGTTAGQRFAIYRDLRVPNLPLTSVGEAVVVSEATDISVLRIVQARDAVTSGDLLIPEKK